MSHIERLSSSPYLITNSGNLTLNIGIISLMIYVQSKFKDVASLEPQCKVQNRIIAGFPAGQLSLLLQAGTDYIPFYHLSSLFFLLVSDLFSPLLPNLPFFIHYFAFWDNLVSKV